MNNKYILILKSLALNLPILRSWGFLFPRVITVVIESGMQVKVMNALANFSVSNNNSEDRNSDFLFYYTGKNGIRDTEIESVQAKHLFDSRGKCGLPLILTDNQILEDEKKTQFFVFLENKVEFEHYDVSEIVPLPEDLKVIRDKLSVIADSAITEEEKVLKAAVYFLEPYCFRNNNMKFMDELMEASNKLCIVDEEARDTGDLEDIFIKTLYGWQRRTNFSDIYELRKIDSLDLDVQNVLFYDAQYVYLSEKMFKHIVEPMMEYVPLNSLKKGLLEAGIIDVNNKDATTYTIKIRIPIPGNKYKRSNLIRLNREKIEAYGEIGIVDACYFSKEDVCNE